MKRNRKSGGPADISVMNGRAEDQQQDAGKAEYEWHAEPCRDDPAENRAGHGADLLGGKEEAENAPLMAGRRMGRKHGIDRRMNGAEE